VSEKFSGADQTLTYEAIMPSGKALQACTSHDLGQNFSKAFDITYQTADKDNEYVWQTSWGFSTRSLGGLILAHGDDDGLVLPPKMAPTQVVIVTVGLSDDEVQYATSILNALRAAGIRAIFDTRDDERFGFKLNKWEVKGVPLIIKIGKSEIENKTVTAQARLNRDEKSIGYTEVEETVTQWLDDIQDEMLKRSEKNLNEQTRVASSYEEFKSIMKEHRGFIKVYWNDDPVIEEKIKQETKATSRCLVDAAGAPGVDFYTGKPSTTMWVFAQSY